MVGDYHGNHNVGGNNGRGVVWRERVTQAEGGCHGKYVEGIHPGRRYMTRVEGGGYRENT